MRIIIYSLFFFCVQCVAGPENKAELLLTQNEVYQVVEKTASALQQNYLFPDKSQQISQQLLTDLRLGKFAQGYPFGRLKQKLESMVISATGDSNFEVIQRKSASVGSTEKASDVNQSGAIKMQLLDKNIGYIGLNGDLVYSNAESDINNAFKYISGVDALIIDLRNADRGTLSLAHSMVSFFFPAGTHLADIEMGRGVKQPLLALEHTGFSQFAEDFPVFVINSSFVAGPWEFLAYTLQQFEKATIVGEDTIGLGYMTTVSPVSQQVNIAMSYAQLKHPLTDENWRDWGVVADFQTSADDSYDKAYAMAADAVGVSQLH